MLPSQQSETCLALANLAPVIPVLVVEDLADARPLAEALVAGGLPVLEITLRSDCALDAIREMAKVPGAHVGAGTVLTADDVIQVQDAGAGFAVSPGSTPALVEACVNHHLALLPGATTASEAMHLMAQGYHMLKFFPAGPAGGAPFIKSLGGPLPQLSFCPTGGVSAANAPDYLLLKNVACVGGSWVAPKDLIQAKDWAGIEALTREAAALARG